MCNILFLINNCMFYTIFNFISTHIITFFSEKLAIHYFIMKYDYFEKYFISNAAIISSVTRPLPTATFKYAIFKPSNSSSVI